MPTLAELGTSANPTLVTVQQNNPVIEPLDGPTPVDAVMDRFPPEVYQQGRDSHLYRFLMALGGDSGVGAIKKLSFNSRLFFEAEALAFQELDSFFAGQFGINRIKSETYPDLDPTGALTPDQWDQILLADASYKQRVIEFFTATRRGNSPEGLRIMAQAGTGIECDLIESYKWIFDQFSDDPLGLNSPNSFLTTSTSEFQIIPRSLNLSEDIYDQGFQETLTPKLTFSNASFSNARPSLGGSGPTTTGIAYYSTPQTRLLPEIERNAIDLLDRLKPVGSLGTIVPDQTRYVEVPIADIFASSTRLNVSRFVTGKSGVPWPTPTAKGNFFIETGVEKEAGYYYGSQRDLPVIFQTVENIHAYTDGALADPAYATKSFYDASSGFSDYEVYRSEFTGNYDRTMSAIFPFLLSLDPNNIYSAQNATAAQNTPLVLESRSVPTGDIEPDDALVNSMYPTSYFSLPGVDPILYPDTFWWGSRARFASVATDGVTYQSVTNGGAQTSEILEIDLGRIREVNYINFDVLTEPVNITIEYDDISTPDRAAVWLPAQPITGLNFDDRIAYNADSRSGWFNAEFNFADNKGNMIHTRYLRITFTRRDEAWPTSQTAPFAWPVLAKHLRVGRYISEWIDAAGPLLSQDTPATLTPFTLESPDNISTREVRQQFVYPSDAKRGNQVPSILGFGILLSTDTSEQDLSSPFVEIAWSIWDVTDSSAPVQLRNGVETGVVTSGLSWLDWYLEGDTTSLHGAIPGDMSKIYELRVSSLTALSANTVYVNDPETLSTKTLPGTFTFTSASQAVSWSPPAGWTGHLSDSVSVGDLIVNSDVPEQVYLVDAINDMTPALTLDTVYGAATDSGATANIVFPFSSYDDTTNAYVQDGSKNLICRVWADVADSGRDVLGNTYRYATRRDLATYVTDNSRAGWMSDANPSANAVEALYFDVRGEVDGVPVMSFLDAIRIAPRSPGVQMNVYYSQQGLTGETPNTEDEWDFLLWHPIQASYILRRSEIVQLPHQVQAAFIKLEFTNLNPGPFRVPTYPTLPPRQYKLFPQWVLNQYADTNTDTFVQAQQPVQTQALQNIVDPTYEFEYDQRSLLSQLALGSVSSSQVVSAGLASVAGVSALDATTAQQVFINTPQDYQSTTLITVDPNESLLGQVIINRFNPAIFTAPVEGSAPLLGNADIPFVSTVNDRLSQAYQGIIPNGIKFNEIGRHSYDVQQAQFNKKAYFVGIKQVQFLRNNYLIEHDDSVIDESVFDPDGDFIFNDWQVETDTGIPDGATLYVSYSVNPTVVDEAVTLNGFVPVELSVRGGPAFSVQVYSQPNQQGLAYFQGQDYDLIYGFDLQGNRTTSIVRSQFGTRLIAPHRTFSYIDSATVIAHGIVPSPPTVDADTVVTTATISGEEGPFVPDFGAGTFGGLTATTSQIAQGGLVIMLTGTVNTVPGEGNFGDMTKHPTDAATVIGTATISAVEHRLGGVHPATINATSTMSGTVTKV